MPITFAVGASRTYTTLSAAWNATAATWTDDYIFELYNDALFTAGFAASGKTVGSFSLTIRPATGQGFRDNPSKNSTPLRFNQANGVAISESVFAGGVIDIVVPLTVIFDGLQIRNPDSAGRVLNFQSGSTRPTVRNCILQTAGQRIVDASNAQNGGFYGNLCVLTNSSAEGLRINDLQPARGNTIVYIGSGSASGTGIQANWGACTSNTNAIFGFTTAHSTANGGTFAAASGNNATNLASTGAGGTGNVVNLAFADQFLAVGAAGSEDLRLKTGNSLAGAGLANANITTDILGVTRPSPPAISAVEFITPPAGPSIPVVVNYYRQLGVM